MPTKFTPAQIKPQSFESRRNSFFGCVSCLRACLGARLLQGGRLVSRGTSVRICLGSPLSSKVVVCGRCSLVTVPHNYETSAKLLISSLNALVQSAGFSLKSQPRLLLLPISFHGLTTAIVSSWVHLILSPNPSRKFRTLLQDLFSWHPLITTQHLSWKNCTGFPFQNVLSIKPLVCVSVL